jgi:hypothetical protein
MLASDIIYAAFRASRVLKAPGRCASASDLTDGLSVLNGLVDEWSARKAYAWSETFTQFTLTANHAPHWIGPGLSSPDFAAAARPVRIESASLVLTNATPNVDVPLNIRDEAWWAQQRVKSLTSNIPTDLYYQALVPNGALNFWPVPAYNYGIRLETWVSLGPFASTSSAVTVPPAYANALKLTLAEELCVYYGTEVHPMLAQKAAQARAALESNNSKSPRTQSADWGNQGSGKGRSGFNWASGLPA